MMPDGETYIWMDTQVHYIPTLRSLKQDRYALTCLPLEFTEQMPQNHLTDRLFISKVSYVEIHQSLGPLEGQFLANSELFRGVVTEIYVWVTLVIHTSFFRGRVKFTTFLYVKEVILSTF